jgi:crotonobetainyl-CoA:carnitine CoA-transferase CaiB-like acyl-CoA transferase
MLTEYMHAGVVRERSGNALLRAAPSNFYPTTDDHWMAIGGNGENVFRRLAKAMGKPELTSDPRFADNLARVAHHEELDEIISAWTSTHTLAELQVILDEAGIPAGPIMNIADIAADPQYQAREMLLQVPDERLSEGYVVMPGIVPKLTETPGKVTHAGRALGVDNRSVYGELLGLRAEDLAQLEAEGVI